MKRKILDSFVLLIGIGICLAPFAGMAVAKTDSTLEKRSLASFPKIIEEDGINFSFGTQLGDYFHDHFAWKNEFVTLDSVIQAKVFGVSSVDTVLVGTENWLYYTDTLDDYLGKNVLTERGVHNLVHNIELMQQNVEDQGAQFLFTIAPNKNSLYNANMPYYTSIKASENRNVSLLAPLLQKSAVNYTDLFQAFRAQKEILYRKQDSHWNEKGAALAYDTIMNTLQKDHRDYSTTPYFRTRSKKGDLATALYALAAKDEWDGEYEYQSCVSFVDTSMDWENPWVQTTGKGQSGSLLMYRDSFGNTLSPLLAEDYQNGAFSRENVYLLDQEMDKVQPDTVVVEIVERNIDRFVRFQPDNQAAEGPPVMQAPIRKTDRQTVLEQNGKATITKDVSAIQPAYTILYGTVDPSLLKEDTRISIEIENADGKTEYEAFQTNGFSESNTQARDNGYVIYLKTENLTHGQAKVRVLLTDAEGTTVAAEQPCVF